MNVSNKLDIARELKIFSNSIRKIILEMSLNAGSSSSHFGGALSIADIISVLFGYKIKIEKKTKNFEDRFILSKGHACLAYYAALHKIEKISVEEIKTFEKDNSDLAGHPVKNKKLGIDFSNGSLGMGLSIAIGIAISFKKRKKNNIVYVILGDGECNEGSVWEAAMAASKFKLDNLVAIVDNNKFQQTGSNKEIMDLENLASKWTSFGWDVSGVDGHNIEKLMEYFDNLKTDTKPKVLIAKTIKGKGFSFSENNNDWHHSIMTKKMYEQAVLEISKWK